MQIEPLSIDVWWDEWRERCEWNLGETPIDYLSLAELLEIIGGKPSDLTSLLKLKLSYGAVQGSLDLRNAIAATHENQTAENIVVTHGASAANVLVHRALVDPGDRVISVVPSYRQLHSIPASIGADVQLFQLREDNNWLPDLTELREIAVPGTKLIELTNPNSQTGALFNKRLLEEIVSIARNCGAWLLCDEVFRGVDHVGPGATAAVADLYDKGISTGGMSKAYSLAGLRIGWLVAPSLVIEDVMVYRDYDTISVGLIDECIATLALNNSERVLAHSRTIARDNLDLLACWIEREPLLSWVRPQAGGTCLVRVDVPMSSYEFCKSLMMATGVLLVPGSVLGMEGYVRIGFGMKRERLMQGLERISGFLATLETSRQPAATRH